MTIIMINKSAFSNKTTHEWEVRIGEQFRALRIDQNIDQESLAERASISRGALRNLESGAGSSLATIIKVTRALARTDWLETLDDTGGEVSPMALLRLQQATPTARQRSSKRSVDKRSAS